MFAWIPPLRVAMPSFWAGSLDAVQPKGQRASMFPIRDHNPSTRRPYVTYALIIANVVIFLSYWELFSDPRALNRFFYDWALIPRMLTQDGAYSGLFTMMFLHGGVLHLAGNMLFLWIFGDNIEDEMGHMPFLLFYVATGVLAGLAQVMAAPYSMVPTVGASGAIAGVMGGYLLLFPKARVDIFIFFVVFYRIFPLPAWIMLALWFGLQIFSGIGANPQAGGVAYWAHAGGFLAGVVLTYPLFLRLGGKRFWAQTHGHPPHPEARYRYAKTGIPKIRRRR